jgi:uncharacterized protein (TIGR02145 family)
MEAEMRVILLITVFFIAFQAVFAAVQTVAVLPSDGDLNANELDFSTDKAQEIAVRVLPKSSFEVFSKEAVIKKLDGEDNFRKACKESSCIVELGKKAQVDYVAQCRFGKLGSDLKMTFELYKVSTEGLIDKFTETAKNFDDLRAIMEKRIPDGFKKIVSVVSTTKVGIDIRPIDVDTFDLKRHYIANIETEPTGAVLSFDGRPDPSCSQTPCRVEHPEGDVRIIANLKEYEIADTTVSIKQKDQNVNIKLKPNFGTLEIKRAYPEGIGMNEDWKLTINEKADSSWKNKRLPPGKHSVKLRHHCYKDINFDVGITKGSHEVFEVKEHAELKKVGLVLSAEKDGSPVSEPVFVNGKRVDETPFSNPVPLCSEIEIGSGKEKVNVKLEYGKTIKYVHKFNSKFTDSRDGKKYKIVKIGEQTWMAENLNYDADGSKCYKNKSENCEKYGRLYNWQTALEACPSGWHLPSKSEYEELHEAIGAGKKLKAKSGWERKFSNGTDEFGFSALPGGYGNPDGSFSLVGDLGAWWSSETYSNDIFAYVQQMFRNNDVEWSYYRKSSLHSVRCLEGEPPQNDAYAYNLRGNTYYEKGDYDKAISAYTQAIQLKPNDVMFYNHRARAYLDKKDSNRAIADYESVLQIDSVNPTARKYLDKRDFNRAITNYEGPLEGEPPQPLQPPPQPPFNEADEPPPQGEIEEEDTVEYDDEYETFTDKRDSKKYRPVEIGNQTWMAKNLNDKPFWVALALDVAGMAFVYYGYEMDKVVVRRYEDYASLGSCTTKAEIHEARTKVENAKTKRNIYYILGSIFLTTGIGVHIWF